MASDDWRLRIELPPETGESLLERLGVLNTDGDELASDLKHTRLAVSHDEGIVFVYASTSAELDRAKPIVQRELDGLHVTPTKLVAEQWLAAEDRWDDDAPAPDLDDEVLAEGYAPWEVRIPCAHHSEAKALADQLDQEGYGIVRRWKYVIAGCATEGQAKELAARFHGTVEAGGDLVYEGLEGHPFFSVSPF